MAMAWQIIINADSRMRRNDPRQQSIAESGGHPRISLAGEFKVNIRTHQNSE
jgi:hypothetical protein